MKTIATSAVRTRPASWREVFPRTAILAAALGVMTIGGALGAQAAMSPQASAPVPGTTVASASPYSPDGSVTTTLEFSINHSGATVSSAGVNSAETIAAENGPASLVNRHGSGR